MVFGSIILRAGYREMPAFVVGNEIVMSSEVAGTVAEIHRQENETYHRGDTLFTIESEAIAAQIAAVEQDLEEINRSLAIEQSREGLERRRFELESAIATDESELKACRLGDRVTRQAPAGAPRLARPGGRAPAPRRGAPSPGCAHRDRAG